MSTTTLSSVLKKDSSTKYSKSSGSEDGEIAGDEDSNNSKGGRGRDPQQPPREEDMDVDFYANDDYEDYYRDRQHHRGHHVHQSKSSQRHRSPSTSPSRQAPRLTEGDVRVSSYSHRPHRHERSSKDKHNKHDDYYHSSSSKKYEDKERKRRHRHRDYDDYEATTESPSNDYHHRRDHRDRTKRTKKDNHEEEHQKSYPGEDLRSKLKRIERLEKESSSRRSTPTTESPAKSKSKSDSQKPSINIRKMTSCIEVEEVDISDDDTHLKQPPPPPRRSRFASESSLEQEVASDGEEGNESDDPGSVIGPKRAIDTSPGEPLEQPTEVEDDKDKTEEEGEGISFVSYFPAIEGCRSVDEFSCLNRIEEGTYGVVYRAECKKTKEIVALKRLKMEKEKEGFPITSLREINTLMKAPHENIVRVKEIVVGSNMDKIFIVMEYVEHDLKSLMESMKKPFLLGEVKTLLLQLLSAVAHLHDNWILHRDLKTSNLLLSHRGILKVGDFGLAREYGSPLKAYTPIVVTLWYRAPELLLETPKYSTPIDVWSIGCIFGELLTMKPFFPGKSEIDQLNLIFKDLGTPNDKIWPGYSDLPVVKKVTFANIPYNSLSQRLGNKINKTGLDLMTRFLAYCPERRISAVNALQHDFFKENPQPIDPSMFPTWPAKSEGSARPKQKASPKAPVGGRLADIEAGVHDDILMGGYRGAGFSLKF